MTFVNMNLTPLDLNKEYNHNVKKFDQLRWEGIPIDRNNYYHVELCHHLHISSHPK
jgi:hypothetical protein